MHGPGEWMPGGAGKADEKQTEKNGFPSISWMGKKVAYPFFQRFNVGKYRVISAMASSLV